MVKKISKSNKKQPFASEEVVFDEPHYVVGRARTAVRGLTSQTDIDPEVLEAKKIQNYYADRYAALAYDLQRLESTNLSLRVRNKNLMAKVQLLEAQLNCGQNQPIVETSWFQRIFRSK